MHKSLPVHIAWLYVLRVTLMLCHVLNSSIQSFSYILIISLPLN
jgi:hypothetical protein